jgi:hypothetical protein
MGVSARVSCRVSILESLAVIVTNETMRVNVFSSRLFLFENAQEINHFHSFIIS